MATDFNSPEVWDLLDRLAIAKTDGADEDIRYWASLYMTTCEKQGAKKIPLTKQNIKSLKQPLFDAAVERTKYTAYAGYTPYQQYLDEEDRRIYLRQIIMSNGGSSKDFFKYLQDCVGIIHTDAAHLKVLSFALKEQADCGACGISSGSPVFLKLADVYYIVRAREVAGTETILGELDIILKQIKKYPVGNTKIEGLSPVYHKINGTCQWTVCPPVMHDYFSHFSIDNGYDLYYFEPAQNLTTFLMADLLHCSYREAYSYTSTHNEGVLYKYLPKQLENKMLPELVNGSFSHFDGVLKDALNKRNSDIACSTSLGGVTAGSNVYTLDIAAKAEAMIGNYIALTVRELKENPNYNKSLADVFFLNTTSFALQVKAGVPIERLLPVNYKYFKKANQGNYYSILDNRY